MGDRAERGIPEAESRRCTSEDALYIASAIADTVSIPDLAYCLKVDYITNGSKSARDKILDILHAWITSTDDCSKGELLKALSQLKAGWTVCSKVVECFRRNEINQVAPCDDEHKAIAGVLMAFEDDPAKLPEQEPQVDFVMNEPIQESQVPRHGMMIGGIPTHVIDYRDREMNPNSVITEQVAEMEAKFSRLLMNVRRGLTEAPIEDIKVFLTDLAMSVKEDINPKGLVFTSHQNEIIAHSTLPQIFQWLSMNGFWSFLNHYLLKKLAKEFANTSLNDQVSEYEREMATFKSDMKLVDFLPAWSGRSPYLEASSEALIIKVKKRDWSSYTLADISRLEGYLESRFLLNRFLFRLANAGSGCVVIMWLVPSHAMAFLKERIRQSGGMLDRGGCPKTLGLDSKWNFEQLYQASITDPNSFWGKMANKFLEFKKPFDKVMDGDMEKGEIKWFTKGELNVSVNCVDRHAKEHPDRIALIWEKNKQEGPEERVTYKKLLDMVCQIANLLKRKKVKKGDIVAIYMPTCPLAVASMLACARIGAVHSVLFSRFDPTTKEAIDLVIAKAKVIITANEVPQHAKKPLDLKKRLDTVMQKLGISKQILVSRRTHTEVNMVEGRDEWLEEAMSKELTECDPEQIAIDSGDDLFILFTSGSSGPESSKAVVHTQAGYLVFVATTFKYYFNCQPGDVYACIADIGDITGHSYMVYGPLCNGATTVLFDNAAADTDPSIYWEAIQRLCVKAFYTNPAVIRSVMSMGRESATNFEMPSLEVIASVGESLSIETWKWLKEEVGKGTCSVIDTWTQTDLGGISMATLDVTTFEPKLKPSFGVVPKIYNDQGQLDIVGKLYLTPKLPGMGRRLIGGDVKQRYFNYKFVDGKRMYCTGDVVHKTTDGDYQILGNEQDVIKLAHTGYLLKTQRLEGEVANLHEDIVEVAITAPTNRDSDTLSIFVSVKRFDKNVKQKVWQHDPDHGNIKKIIQGFFWRKFNIPVSVKIMPDIKKTFSGKIIRYLLREMEEEYNSEPGTMDPFGDYYKEDIATVAAEGGTINPNGNYYEDDLTTMATEYVLNFAGN